MRGLVTILASLGLAMSATAQVTWSMTSGNLTAKATNPNSEPVEICFFRTDQTPEVQLGCVADVQPGAMAQGNYTIPMTPGRSAEIRGYATSADGLRSEVSTTFAIVPMPPLPPVLVQ